MLELIREKMQGVFATVLVGFFCLVFALWGVENLFNNAGSKDAVVSINGEDVSSAELDNAIKMMRQRYMEMLGGQVDASFLNDKMLREPALDSLINRKLLEMHLAESKLRVSTATADKSIVRDPQFSRDGKIFDAEFYREQLRRAGIPAVVYQRDVAQRLAMTQWQTGIASTAFVTEQQVADVARLMAQKRRFEYVRLPLQQAIDMVVVDDAAVEQHYKDHQQDYLSDEKVTIEYLDLNKADLLKDISVAEADVRAAYDKEVAAFQPLTERRAAHILVEAADENAAQATLGKIRDALANGKDFAELAKEYSKDEGSAAQGGDVGFTSGSAFVPEFESALASLAKVGDVSGPVKSEFGYHIIKLLEERQTSAPAFEERRAALEAELKQGSVADRYAEKLDQLTEATYSAGDLAGPAAELGLALQKTAPFSRRGGTGIAAQQKLLDVAFSPDLLDSGKNSEVIELSPERAVVLRVVDHVLPAPRPLEEVKGEISAQLKRERAVAALKQRAAELKAEAQKGVALSELAARSGLALLSVEKTREEEGKGEDMDLVKQVFAMPKPVAGQVQLDAAELSNGDWAVFSLIAVEDQPVAPGVPAYDATAKRLDSAVGMVDFSLLQEHLRSQATIKRREESAPTAGQ